MNTGHMGPEIWKKNICRERACFDVNIVNKFERKLTYDRVSKTFCESGEGVKIMAILSDIIYDNPVIQSLVEGP